MLVRLVLFVLFVVLVVVFVLLVLLETALPMGTGAVLIPDTNFGPTPDPSQASNPPPALPGTAPAPHARLARANLSPPPSIMQQSPPHHQDSAAAAAEPPPPLVWVSLVTCTSPRARP